MAAPRLVTLPTELLLQIVKCLDEKPDIASLRLVNKRLDAIAAQVLFETATLYPQWFYDDRQLKKGSAPSQPKKGSARVRRKKGSAPGGLQAGSAPSSLKYDATVFKNIIEHPFLSKLVKKVILHTVEPDCHHDTYPHYESAGIRNDPQWEECINHLDGFPHVNSVRIDFERRVCGDGVDHYLYLFQVAGERREVIEKVFSQLSGRLTGLSLRHYENGLHLLPRTNEGTEEHKTLTERVEQLWETLGTLKSFRMSVVHEEGDADRWKDGHPQDFWTDFPKLFLEPMQNNLKRLLLYSSLRIGFSPKVDFRSAHFPHLKSLTLGFFAFCRDWQFDWILSHADTLVEINLDSCSILFQVYYTTVNWLDEDGFPRGDVDPGEHVAEFNRSPPYQTRWYEVFQRFADELGLLREFRFGISDGWRSDESVRVGGGWQSVPRMPWEAERAIENQIFNGAYIAYMGWDDIYESCSEFDLEDLDDEERARVDPPPQCRDEDEAALRKLLEKLGKDGSLKKDDSKVDYSERFGWKTTNGDVVD